MKRIKKMQQQHQQHQQKWRHRRRRVPTSINERKSTNLWTNPERFQHKFMHTSHKNQINIWIYKNETTLFKNETRNFIDNNETEKKQASICLSFSSVEVITTRIITIIIIKVKMNEIVKDNTRHLPCYGKPAN